MRTFHSRSGFVLPVVLGIILLAALIAVQSATELGGTTLLATQRQLHQRAFEAAENGVANTLYQLASGVKPSPVQQLPADATSAGAATVTTNTVARHTLPAGFSADRIVETRYEIRSTGHSARGSEVTVVQGAWQLQLAAAP